MKYSTQIKMVSIFIFHCKKIDNPVVLEIGTNLGISGSYLIEAIKNRNGKFITMEGVPKLCEIASNQFSSLASQHQFEIKEGLYEKTFLTIIKDDIKFNFLFIDGNHKKQPTLEYFSKLKSKINSPAVFIFDDINWSKEMQETWEIVKKDSDVNYAIDLYEQGIIIIDKNDSRKNQNFHLHLAY